MNAPAPEVNEPWKNWTAESAARHLSGFSPTDPKRGDWLRTYSQYLRVPLDVLEDMVANLRAVAEGASTTQAQHGERGDIKTVEIRSASTIKEEPIYWIWEGWIAGGKLHMLAGSPGTGKTTIAIGLAAALSCGGYWPDGTRAEAADVLIWSGEDDHGDTLVPRLKACGADMERVHFVGDVDDGKERRPFDPAHDVDALMLSISMVPNPKLIIVDPIVSAVAVDSHKNGEVRRALQPLVDFGLSHKCAILGISHFTKGTMGREPLERVTGSLAFGALPRIVMATAKEQDEGDTKGRRILVRAKSNISLDHGGFYYVLEPCTTEAGNTTTRVLWAEAIEGTAREILAQAESPSEGGGKTAVDDAGDWLREVLADGALNRKDVLQRAREAGFSESTIDRAKSKAGVVTACEGFGKSKRSMWSIPVNPVSGCHTKNLDGNGDLDGNGVVTGFQVGQSRQYPQFRQPSECGNRDGNGRKWEGEA